MKVSIALVCAASLMSLGASSCSSDEPDGGSNGSTSGDVATTGATTATSSSAATGTGGPGSGGQGAGGSAAVGTGGGDPGPGPAGTGGGTGTGGETPGELAVGLGAIRQVTIGEIGDGGSASTTPASSELGSLFLVSVARGDWAGAPDAPSDSYGNAFAAIDGPHAYADWPTSATALYGLGAANGGAGHTFSMSLAPSDEVTLTAIEVRGASEVLAAAWREEAAASSITSGAVHVDGPALLVAWWWGSGGVRPVGASHVAEPGDGFTVLPEATGVVSLSASGYIQVATAYRSVDAAGDYSVTWTTDDEGAQLYLVAVR